MLHPPGQTSNKAEVERFRSLRCALWLLLPAFIVALLAIAKPIAASWSPDGVLYARMMLVDAHWRRPDDAFSIRTGSTFFRDPVHRVLQERLFRNRVLYPWIGSLLYPERGLESLIDVARVSYVLAVYVVLALVARFAGIPIGSLCAAAFAAFPEVRSLANWALTDMLAIALWSAVLWALVVAWERRTWEWSVIFGVLVVALALERPMIYYPVLAAGALAVVRRDATSYRLAAIAMFLAIAYFVGSKFAGFPGLAEELQWVHRHAQDLDRNTSSSMFRWWVAAFAAVAIEETDAAIRLVYPALLLVAAVFGMWLKRDLVALALLAGSFAATAISVAANPVAWAFDRTAELPLVPIVLVGVGLLIKEASLVLTVSVSKRVT